MRRDDTRPYKYTWYWNMDYGPVRYHQLPEMIGKFRRVETEIRNISKTIRITQSSLLSLEPLIEQGEVLEKLLLILSLPALGMIFYYIILTANLTIKRRSNEIALLRSRGSSIFQIVINYLVEWGFLSLIAYFVGPQLGLVIARLMGAFCFQRTVTCNNSARCSYLYFCYYRSSSRKLFVSGYSSCRREYCLL